LAGSRIAQPDAFGFEEFVVRAATSRFSESPAPLPDHEVPEPVVIVLSDSAYSLARKEDERNG
jgi:hypothetical protein